MVRTQSVNPSLEDNFFVGPIRTLVLISAAAAILGGLLLMSGDFLGLVTGRSDDTYSNSPVEKVMAILFLAGKVFVLIGLVGLYLRQAKSAGRFGVVAFLIALAGTGLMIASDWSEVFTAPILTDLAPPGFFESNPPALVMAGFILNFVTEILGWMLFGIATFRARILPRLAALLLIAGPLVLFGPSWSWMIWNGAIVWLGVAVLRSLARAPSVPIVGSEALEQV